MVLQCSLNAWLKELTSGDQRRLTGSGSVLEACSRRCAIQTVYFAYFLVYYYINSSLVILFYVTGV